MEKEQALQILKQTIDQAIALGLFKNTESVITVSQALAVITEKLIPQSNN